MVVSDKEANTGSSAAAAVANSTRISDIPCSCCGAASAKYRCPGCNACTCSVACVKAHKSNTGCTGVRSKNHFIRRSAFTEMDMQSDIGYLEDTARAIRTGDFQQGSNNNDNISSGNNDSGKSNAMSVQTKSKMEKESSHAFRRDLLVRKAKQRSALSIIQAPLGMSRRKANVSKWNPNKQCIMWTIDVKEFDEDGKAIGNGLRTLTGVKDELSIEEIIEKKSQIETAAASEEEAVVDNAGETNSRGDDSEPKHDESFVALMKRPGGRVTDKFYYRLPISVPFYKAIEKTSIIEYPSIEIHTRVPESYTIVDSQNAH